MRRKVGKLRKRNQGAIAERDLLSALEQLRALTIALTKVARDLAACLQFVHRTVDVARVDGTSPLHRFDMN
jgi:hypothetical protein